MTTQSAYHTDVRIYSKLAAAGGMLYCGKERGKHVYRPANGSPVNHSAGSVAKKRHRTGAAGATHRAVAIPSTGLGCTEPATMRTASLLCSLSNAPTGQASRSTKKQLTATATSAAAQRGVEAPGAKEDPPKQTLPRRSVACAARMWCASISAQTTLNVARDLGIRPLPTNELSVAKGILHHLMFGKHA